MGLCRAMRRTHGWIRKGHSEEQILRALRQTEAGARVSEICREHGISDATFYIWKKKYADLGLNELRELRQLREVNGKLERLVADLSLDPHILQEIVRPHSALARSFSRGILSAAGKSRARHRCARLGRQTNLSACAVQGSDTADPKPSPLFGPPSDMKGEAEKLKQVVSARPQNRLSLEVVN